MELNDVSKTTIITLRCRVIETEREQPILRDPMARTCLDALYAMASEDYRQRLFDRKLRRNMTNPLVLRARKFDSITNEFIAKNPSCTVVNLGCGFDTRFWRINNQRCRYVELDLPEIVELKKAAMQDRVPYEVIACSVLDTTWIDHLTTKGNRNFLLLAEGLFQYLPRAEVIGLFKTFTQRFISSQIVLEVVTEAYTHGFWKKVVASKTKHELGLDSGSSYEFGVKNARELETYGPGIKVIGEWSFVDDPDARPCFYKYLGISRTQWTVIATINAGK